MSIKAIFECYYFHEQIGSKTFSGTVQKEYDRAMEQMVMVPVPQIVHSHANMCVRRVYPWLFPLFDNLIP